MKSTDMITPTPLKAPIANEGLRNTIPDNATGSNYASIQEGFPGMTMKAPADGGLPPWGQDFNGMFYMMSSQTCFLQNGGLITFDADVSAKIGGYPQGAILDYVTSNNTYVKVKSLIDDNTYNFITTPSYIDGEHWKAITLASSIGGGLEVGTLFPVFATSAYIPEGAMPADGTEYSNLQFPDLWNNYLTADIPLLITKNYTQYQAEITAHGNCAAFGVEHIITSDKSSSTITRVEVKTSDWETTVSEIGSYLFSYDNSKWMLNQKTVTLSDYGIVLMGDPTSGDTVTVDYTYGTNFKVPTIKDTLFQGINFNAEAPVVPTSDKAQPIIKSDIDGGTGLTTCNFSGHPYGQLHAGNGTGAQGCFSAYWADPKLQADLSKSISINNPTIRWFVQLSTGSINESQMDWSQWAASLTGKANTDANNLTQTGKANIITLLNLDYASMVTVAGKQEFTATKSGMFFQPFDDGEESKNWTVTRNGNTYKLPNMGTWGQDGNCLQFIFQKGDIFNRDGASDGYYCPFIGEE